MLGKRADKEYVDEICALNVQNIFLSVMSRVFYFSILFCRKLVDWNMYMFNIEPPPRFTTSGEIPVQTCNAFCK